VEHVAIVGQGNVAVDCARILSKTSAELAETDICAHALEKLKQSNVKKVSMYGRRGGVQVSLGLLLYTVGILFNAEWCIRQL